MSRVAQLGFPPRLAATHNKMYRKQLLERRAESIKSAQPLTRDEAVIRPYRLQVLTLVDQLEVALNSLRTYDDGYIGASTS